jgi:hypothetical protein
MYASILQDLIKYNYESQMDFYLQLASRYNKIWIKYKIKKKEFYGSIPKKNKEKLIIKR